MGGGAKLAESGDNGDGLGDRGEPICLQYRIAEWGGRDGNGRSGRHLLSKCHPRGTVTRGDGGVPLGCLVESDRDGVHERFVIFFLF